MAQTIAAISTGQAPGGLGVIRVSGPEAVPICEKVFGSHFGKRLSDLAGYTAAYGEIHDQDGEKLDDCVALVFRAPKSYTGEDVVELSCHGGLYVTRQVLGELLKAGAVPAGPGEFTRRAFLNGKLDLAQAEAVMELISADGKHAAQAAQAGTSGALSKRIHLISSWLQDLTAHLAAWADFPEEDVEAVTSSELLDVLTRCQAELERLLEGFEKGRVYREGLRTVIFGRPNVGKSTLMNLLAGRERSIVSPYAGTTRDVIEDQVALAGVPLLLADTAGLRDTKDPVEEIGVAAARKRLGEAELVLAVFEGSAELTQEDYDLMDLLGDLPAIAVVNKCDLDQKLDLSVIQERFSHWVMISAETGSGLDDLEQAFTGLLGTTDFNLRDPELLTERQKTAALSARDAVCQGIEALEMGLTLDAVTVCVEDALSALFSLTGQKVSDEVIDQVFEQFCVGK